MVAPTVVPEFRTVAVGKTAKFSWTKDPADQAWYSVDFGEDLTTVDSVDIIGPDESLVSTDDAVIAMQKATVFLTGGTTSFIYQIRIGAITPNGETIYRVARLEILAQGDSVVLPPTPAPPGPTNIIFRAGGTIILHRALMLSTGGTVIHADPLDPAYVFAGISTSPGFSPNNITAADEDVISDGAWTWTPGAPLFCIAGGVLTATPPTTGIFQQIATAITATTILIQPQTPIVML